MATGGDIIEITYNHPTIGSGVLYPKAGEDNNYFPGGVTTGSDANMITSAGDPIYQMNRSRGYFVVNVANEQNTRQDLEKIIELSGHPEPADWTFTVINGVVYGGKGKPVDVPEGNINQSTFSLRVEGGMFKKIAG